jgi:putative SOS response-associated peptidase YedK
MCGRYTLSTPAPVLAERFRLPSFPELRPRYNVAPTQDVPVVRLADGSRELVLLRWGLVPAWAADPTIGHRLVNARSETVAGKPSFHSAFRQRRCLIPADGFYEWQPRAGKKQPWLFRLRGGEPFAFAGLWEHWEKGGGEPLETCTVLTTEANDIVRPVHGRMPVILPESAYAAWLDPGVKAPGVLLELLQPFPAAEMTAVPVGLRVNSPRFDDPQCVAEVSPA